MHLHRLKKSLGNGDLDVNDNKNDRRWRELCEAILEEPDPVRLQYLAEMLNSELEKREKRMRERHKGPHNDQL
jgi:hypothetical protein